MGQHGMRYTTLSTDATAMGKAPHAARSGRRQQQSASAWQIEQQLQDLMGQARAGLHSTRLSVLSVTSSDF